MSQMPPTLPTLGEPTDPFVLGWRPREVVMPDGRVEEERLPLTLEDLLHPREGDVILERPIHQTDRAYITNVFRSRPLGPPQTFVSSDCLIDWGVEGMRGHSPDVAVFVGMRERPDEDAGTIDPGELRGRCILAVEIVSPDSRSNDVDRKMDHYHAVGVRAYVLIDQERHGGPRTVYGFRRSRRGWRGMTLRDDDTLPLPELGLALGIGENRRAVCYDLATGVALGDYDEVVRRLDETDRRNAELEEIAEEHILQSREDRRMRAEAERRAEAADRQRDEERQRREAAEANVARLEAMIRAMQQGSPPTS